MEEGTVVAAVCEHKVNVGSSQGPDRDEVSSTTADPTSSAEVTTTETRTADPTSSAEVTTTKTSTATALQLQGGGQRSSEEVAEVEYTISVHNESMGDLDLCESGGFTLELHDKSRLSAGIEPQEHRNERQEHWNERQGHVKRKMSDRKHSKVESGQRRHRTHHKEREKKRRERIQDQRHRSDSDDSDDHRRRRKKYDRCDCCHRRRHECSRNHQEGCYGNHDYERHTESYHASGSYQREKEHHRSRLYSDDYPPASGHQAGPRASSESGAKHSDSDSSRDRRKRYGSRHRPRRGSRSLEEKRRQRYRSEEREAPHHSSRLKSEVRKVTEEYVVQKNLAKELNDLDVEIKDNKKELLKSLLRRERLELLHRSLHGEQLHRERGQSAQEQMRIETDQASSNSSSTSTGKMVQELSNLDQAIRDGKIQLLRVMKRMEEEKAEEQSMDSS